MNTQLILFRLITGIITFLLFCQITVAKPRFTKVLYDAKGVKYQVYIEANDEKVETPDLYDAYQEGDLRAYGHYKASILKKGWKKPILQKVPLFSSTDNSGEFNINREMVFVLSNKATGQPDILVVSQYGASSSDSATAFFIQNNQLNRISFYNAKKQSMSEVWFSREPSHRLHGIGSFNYISGCYDNTVGKYEYIKWQFVPKKCSFVTIKEYSDEK